MTKTQTVLQIKLSHTLPPAIFFLLLFWATRQPALQKENALMGRHEFVVIVTVTLLIVNELIDIWFCISVLREFGLDISFPRGKSVFDVLTNQELDYVRQKGRPWSVGNSSWNCLSKKCLRRQPDDFPCWYLTWLMGVHDFLLWFLIWHLIFNEYYNWWSFVFSLKYFEKLEYFGRN